MEQKTAEGEPKFMAQALRLARKGLGRTAPNPPVGAVVVKDRKVVGEGFHRYFGAPHAEVEALKKAGATARGADLYVTLEPCGHYGKTPPCSKAIAEAGIARVFYASSDPNPITAGKGPSYLREKGITVQQGLLQEECDYLYQPYRKWIATGLPLVTAKWAMTLDGKIGTKAGLSRWITSKLARRVVHSLRNQVDAVVVGTNTVITDDPLLTCRIRGGKTPLRVVLDRRKRIPLDRALFNTTEEGPVLLYTASSVGTSAQDLQAKGLEVAFLPEEDQGLSLKAMLEDLGRRGIQHLLVEGGEKLLGSFFDQNLVDRVLVFMAPKVFGGKGAPTPVGGRGVHSIDQAKTFRVRKVQRLGPDLAVWADLVESEGA